MNITFREALKDDLLQILNIEIESFEEPWPEEIFKMMLQSSKLKKSENKTHNFYVCEEENKINGYVIWEKEFFYEKSKDFLHSIGHILNFCVKPEERRKGYGRKMIEFSFKKMVEDKLDRCYLEVRESNSSARRLYDSIGMKYTSKLHDYYQNEDGLVYTMKLRQN